MQTIGLNGGWSVRAEALGCEGEKGYRRVRRARGGWIDARVPGEVHLDLIKAGMMDEPLVGTRAPRCRWPERKSWWFRTTFHVPARFLAHERQQLVFDGLDLYAQVFLNGTLIGSAANAFVPAAFDAGDALRRGRNELVVRLTAGSELALAREPYEPEPGADPVYGRRRFPPRRWLRKPQFVYGWDWADALPNIGIGRDVHLEGRHHVVLHDIRFSPDVAARPVRLDVEAILENLHPWSERACVLELRIDPPRGRSIRRRIAADVPVGRGPVRLAIDIPDARLWWPNGMGEQPLYHVTARVLDGRVECDRREYDVGLRTVEIDRSPLAEGARFCVRVNGQDVFCRGANWCPVDSILARPDRRKYEALVADARDAHFTMFRLNGVGTVEHPAFYDACDRAGILVWHDFMFSCSTYPDHDTEFRHTVRDETEALVLGLRHHPCIALWCGSNENTWGFAMWWNQGAGKPEAIGGWRLYNEVLPDVCRTLDPDRPYWACSPLGGADPNDELTGDCHWWHPCAMNPDVLRRVRHEVFDECRARFASEYGSIAPCHMDSIRQYLEPNQRRLDSRAWKTHTNTFERGTVAAGIRHHYADRESFTLAEYVLYGQMVQAMMHGGAMEALRFRKGDPRDDCQGALIWSYSDCWGETGWTVIDYYLRRKAAYYWLRRACVPLKAIVRRRGRRLVTRVVNDTLERHAGTIRTGWWRIDGTDCRVKSRSVTVPANGMVEVRGDAIPGIRTLDPHQWVYAAVLERDGAAVDQSIWPMCPHRELALARPDIHVAVRGRAVDLSSPVYCHGVYINDHGRAVLSDNYVDLLPGVPVHLDRLDGKSPVGLRFRAVMPG